jgi:hypothetical protein
MAFAIIMLNTDLHSKQLKQRMTFKQFKRNCRAIDPKFEKDYLFGIYERIQETELRFNDQEVCFFNCFMFCSRDLINAFLLFFLGRLCAHIQYTGECNGILQSTEARLAREGRRTNQNTPQAMVHSQGCVSLLL